MTSPSNSNPLLLSILAVLGGCSTKVEPTPAPADLDAAAATSSGISSDGGFTSGGTTSDGSTSSDHISSDGGISSDDISFDGGASSDDISSDGGASSDHIRSDGGASSDDISADGGVNSDGGVSSDDIGSDGGVAYVGTGCYTVSEGTTECLAAAEVSPQDLTVYDACDVDVTHVTGEGAFTASVGFEGPADLPGCCYPITGIDNASDCTVGRPYFERGRSLMAPFGDCAEGGRGSGALTRGAAWALAGAGEHASVAAFARLSLQLMAVGAPTELLLATHQAAVDEVKHAEACWALAHQFGTKRVEVGGFPFGGPVNAVTSLADLAAATVREGCLAETLGAHLAAAAAERTVDPDVKRVLTSIAEEEARHSVLSFRIVAWALQTGGEDVRNAVQAALAQPWPRVDVNELAIRAGVTRDELARVSSQGVAEVLVPAVRQLMAAAA